jgi:hypothetical protein
MLEMPARDFGFPIFVNDSRRKYQLRSMPGRFSGLRMVCLMYAAFTVLNPAVDIGFDLATEYAVAQQMKQGPRRC